MPFLRYFIVIFVCSLFLSPAVKADNKELKDRHKQFVLETRELLDSMDLSDDARSFQIRDIKIGQSFNEVKKLYPDSNFIESRAKILLINKENEAFEANGIPVSQIKLELKTRATDDKCKEQINTTASKLISKYGTPKSDYYSGGSQNMEWYTGNDNAQYLRANMRCKKQVTFVLKLTANANFGNKHVKEFIKQRSKEWHEIEKNIKLKHAPTQEMNF